jgi:hypothetical protein
MKTIVETLLRQTGRANIDKLLSIMERHGYYSVPSNNHHHRWAGTLHHSLEVLLYALKHNKYHVPKDSLIIVCLLHDICKIHGYRHINGHSKRSIKLIQDVAKVHLNSNEYYAIKYHMKNAEKVKKYCNNYILVINSPLWKLIRKADGYSAHNEMTEQELMQNLQEFL